MGRRSGTSIETTIYNTFHGADFSTDPSLVEKYRSPLCTNIMADSGGMPEKRPGWRTLLTLEGEIYGLFQGMFDGEEKLLAHAGTALYAWTEDGETELLLSNLAAHKSRGVYLGGKLWIVTGGELISYDGVTAQRVTEGDCYVPTIIITREPTGGGVTYEDVNLLTPLRKEAFQTDGTTKAFQVSSGIDDAEQVRAWVWGEETEDFTVSGQTITFDTAPAAPSAGSADGVVIQYPHAVSGYAGRINGCTIISAFGIGRDERLVLSGNGEYKNYDWMSAIDEPTYFPDLGYSVVGSDDTAIMGYARVGSYQAIIKENSRQGSTVYLRSGYLNDDNEAVFILQPAFAGVGAVSPGSFATLLDDPLFLSATGIYGISAANAGGTRVTQNRSYFIDPRLLRESGLQEAEAVAWDGLYLLACGAGHVYVLDARQEKSYRSAANADYLYEAYYWENIPAACWLKSGDGSGSALYFGTAAGQVCRFNTDLTTMARYNDDGAAICAVWATRYDDDGTPGYLKTLLKKGCCVTIKPFTRSSGAVYFRTDRTDGTESFAKSASMDIFDWGDIDFARFTFSTDESPREIFFTKKVKNYKRLQIIVRNDEKDEGFGIYQITKFFVVGNFARK